MYGYRKFISGFALSVSLWGGPTQAATYVYVSNAEDGTIGMYTMENDGTLKPGAAIEAGKLVMPMNVSPDKRFLFAAVRSQPFSAVSYRIDRATGALKLVAKAPLAESLPYIYSDKSGKWLLGASYGGHKVTVNPIGKDGEVGKELQVVPTALNAHAILTDKSNKYAFVPHLGTDQVFQFRFDAKTGKLSSNTPATVQIKSRSGPRHLIFSNDNKFVYLLNELTAVVTTLALDQKTGLLTQVSEASALPGDSKLQPGAPRVPAGTGGPARDVSNDIWASDLHLTPDGKFLYAAGAHEQLDRCLQRRRGDWQVDVSLEHTGRKAAARLPHPPERKVHGGERSAVEHDFGLCHRGERRPEAAAKIPDGQGHELGRDR